MSSVQSENSNKNQRHNPTIKAVVRIRYAEIISGNVPEYTPFVIEYPAFNTPGIAEWWHDFTQRRSMELLVNSTDYARVKIHYDGEEYILSPGATIVAYDDYSMGIVTNGQVTVIDSETYSVKR